MIIWRWRVIRLKNHKPLFTERYGLRKAWHVAGFCIAERWPTA